MAIVVFVIFTIQASNVFGQKADPDPKLEDTAMTALRSAAPIVYGQTFAKTPSGSGYYYAPWGSLPPDYNKLKEWLSVLTYDPAFIPKYNEGLSFTDAVEFLKKRIASPSDVEDRIKAISSAFQEVYGCDSTPAEQAYWDAQIKAQKAWYATVVTGEVGNLNSNSSVRTAVIHRAYQTAMGRQANQDNIGYWLPRKEDYRLMMQSHRRYLYSANGVTDLLETIARALQIKNGKKPSDPELKQALIKYSATNMIYAEMIK